MANPSVYRHCLYCQQIKILCVEHDSSLVLLLVKERGEEFVEHTRWALLEDLPPHIRTAIMEQYQREERPVDISSTPWVMPPPQGCQKHRESSGAKHEKHPALGSKVLDGNECERNHVIGTANRELGMESVKRDDQCTHTPSHHVARECSNKVNDSESIRDTPPIEGILFVDGASRIVEAVDANPTENPSEPCRTTRTEDTHGMEEGLAGDSHGGDDSHIVVGQRNTGNPRYPQASGSANAMATSRAEYECPAIRVRHRGVTATDSVVDTDVSVNENELGEGSRREGSEGDRCEQLDVASSIDRSLRHQTRESPSAASPLRNSVSPRDQGASAALGKNEHINGLASYQSSRNTYEAPQNSQGDKPGIHWPISLEPVGSVRQSCTPQISSPSRHDGAIGLAKGETCSEEAKSTNAQTDQLSSSSTVPQQAATCGSVSTNSHSIPTTNIPNVKIGPSTALAHPRKVGRGVPKGEEYESKAESGWGVFCEGALKRGDIVFREKAFLTVSKDLVDEKLWWVIDKMTQIAASLSWIHLNSVDLLQAVLWDQADSSCQELVLQLFAPDEARANRHRLQAWENALIALESCGVLRGTNSVASKQSERLAKLLKVLLICEVNIFGDTVQAETEGENRYLFKTACRINHSCLPNTTYDIKNGEIVLRALCNLEPGTELTISYLPYRSFFSSTPRRQKELLNDKLFKCGCPRCRNILDMSRGFRCPRCFKGTVYPLTAHEQVDSSYSSPRVTCRAPAEDAETTPCNRCGRVPAAQWLESAERLETDIVDAMQGLEYDSSFSGRGWTLTTTFAAALYLFTGHHALAMMHSVMAAPLLNEHRFHEAAYHLHEALVIWKTIADRPGQAMAEHYHYLGYALGCIAGLLIPASQVQSSGIPPGIKHGTYTALVQTRSPSTYGAPKGHGCVGEQDLLAKDHSPPKGTYTEDVRSASRARASEGGPCVACDRRHGRLWDYTGDPSRFSGRQGTSLSAAHQEWLVVALDSSRALEKAGELYSTIFGPFHSDAQSNRQISVHVEAEFARERIRIHAMSKGAS